MLINFIRIPDLFFNHSTTSIIWGIHRKTDVKNRNPYLKIGFLDEKK
jgi:hypothetical protein